MNVLVIGIGNPSRGDDAIGPLLVERLERRAPPGVEWLTDFQLQVEHLLDLHGRDEVIFVDASESAAPPFEFAPTAPQPSHVVSTHALPPAAVLAAYERHYGAPPPPAFTLAVRGEAFELGEGLSAAARDHLDAALAFLDEHLRHLHARHPTP